MATTTNYSWSTPDDTALVKDGAAAIRSLGTAIDTTTYNNSLLPIVKTIVDAKGDIIAATAADTVSRLAVGADGTTLVANSATATGLEWQTPSSGQLTWTQRQTGTNSTFNSIAYNGTNLYVAGGNAGVLYSSPDALTWTSRTSGFGANNILSIAFGNGLFVAVGNNGTITTSPDGITWTARTANMATSNIYDVLYANSLWVAVGDGGGTTNTGGLTYSSDGITWTRKSQSLTVGTDYYTVAYNGTNWIIGATSSTNNHLYASTPSGTWTAGTTGVTTTVSLILWDGTRNIVVQGTTVAFSTSVTLGTTTVYNALTSTNQDDNTKKYFKLYSNVLYRFSLAMQTYVPISTAYPSMSVPVLLPTTTIGASTLANGVQTSFVGADGIILIGTGGRISTSF